MDPSARKIHDALQIVFELRQQHRADPALAQASAEVKRFQARRFQATYADLLQSPRYKTATAFFLHDLYSDRDYTERDQQFARIAGAIAKLFPQAVVNTAAALAEVHALTETLDDQMARQWLASRQTNPQDSESARYIRCWRGAGDAAARHQQLEVVLQLGQALDRLTRTLGLRTLLRMMRHPAAAAGLTSLQHFLETGFDAFAGMRGADEFLRSIRDRETEWIRSLFEDETFACETRLRNLLAAFPA
ncbi:MAG: FFLEELY motif protein [Polaromonas sp.]